MNSTVRPAEVKSEGPFYIEIAGLPRDHTWQDLKDVIRNVARRAIWTEILAPAKGRTPGKAYARINDNEEAVNAYRFLTESLIEGRLLNVHLWEIVSGKPAEFLRCNCEPMPAQHPPISQIVRMGREVIWRTAMTNSPTAKSVGSSQGTPISPLQPILPRVHPPYQIPDRVPARAMAQDQLAMQFAGLGLNPRNLAQTSLQQVQYAQPSTAHCAPYATNSNGAQVNTSNGYVINQARGVFVTGINFKARLKDVEAVFRRAGEIEESNLPRDRGSNKSKGIATICYKSSEAARAAVRQFDDTDFMGMRIKVRLDKEQTATSFHSFSPSAESISMPVIVNGSAGEHERGQSRKDSGMYFS